MPHRRLVILGAGFTGPAGLPLTSDLLVDAFRLAEQLPWRRPDGSAAVHGLGEWLFSVLDWYYPTLGLQIDDLRAGRMPVGFRLEDFLSLVSVRAAMGYATPQDRDPQAGAFIDCLRRWLGQAVLVRQEQALAQLPPHYLAFAAALGDAIVVSFNWNTLLEHAWAHQGLAWTDGAWPGDSALVLPRLLKVHGSVDWFALEPGDTGLEPLGPGLPTLGRARDVAAAYAEGRVPHLVMPTYDKTGQLATLEQLWQEPWWELQNHSEVVVIGYSIRPDDYHGRAVLYPRLVRHAREGTLRVKVVDCASTPEAQALVRERYAGVEGCRFWFEGFSAQALDFIFSDAAPP